MTEGTKVYVAGSRTEEALAREAMKAVELEGWVPHNWLALMRLTIKGDLRNTDALDANKKALDDSKAVLLVEPARGNGRAEAAYAAGQGKDVVVWQAKECLDPGALDMMHCLLRRWNTDKLDQAIGWLRELLEGAERGKAWREGA